MEATLDEVQKNVNLFSEMLTCGSSIYTWIYNKEGVLSSTNCPYIVLDKIFESTGCKEYLVSYSKQNDRPVILSAQQGLMWAAAIAKINDKVRSIYVIGPVFNTDMSTAGINAAIDQPQIPIDFRPRFRKILQEMPVASSVLFFQYAVMLHYCANGEKLSRSDLSFQETSFPEGSAHTGTGDRHQTWLAEQRLLKNVKEGNLDFQSELEQAGMLSNGVRISTDKPLTQMIITESIFVSLCTRAAIDGGMTPEMAYSLGDSYIEKISKCKSLTELRSLGHMMYEEFITRVHHIRTDGRYTAQIQSCVDMIELHPDEELSIDILAARVGYSPYYLSRKFKSETGMSINDCIKRSRVERAKALLTYSDMTVSAIAEELHFCSGSHFSDTFKRITGQLPQAYRDQTRRA